LAFGVVKLDDPHFHQPHGHQAVHTIGAESVLSELSCLVVDVHGANAALESPPCELEHSHGWLAVRGAKQSRLLDGGRPRFALMTADGAWRLRLIALGPAERSHRICVRPTGTSLQPPGVSPPRPRSRA
jgi:hypothetical protein